MSPRTSHPQQGTRASGKGGSIMPASPPFTHGRQNPEHGRDGDRRDGEESATDFALAISPLSVNVLDWASEVQRRLNEVGIVDSLQLGAMELSSNVQDIVPTLVFDDGRFT